MMQDVKEVEDKLKEVTAYSVEQLPVISVWVPYKTLNNLAELPIGSIHKVTALGYAKHYGTDKLVAQLTDGALCQAGEFLETCKDSLHNGCKIIIIEKLRLDKARRKSAVCKIVQQGDWSGLVYYKQFPMLSAKTKTLKFWT